MRLPTQEEKDRAESDRALVRQVLRDLRIELTRGPSVTRFGEYDITVTLSLGDDVISSDTQCIPRV